MTRKYLFSFVAFLLATQSLFAQFKISGIVKDKQANVTLAGAAVYINDLKIGVSTDQNGYFEIKNLRAGHYFVEVSYLGLNTVANQYLINKDTRIDFSLTASHKELTEVVITGLSRSTEIRQNPVIIKALDKNYLNQNSATNLIDALKNVPGISQITTGVAIAKPVIRGLGYNRVISLLNGVKQEGQQWGDEHGIEIDEYAIDKIEIIKGPGSLMYGSDGIAGVINFLSPKAPALGQIKTQLVSNYQSNNNLIGYSVSNAGNLKGIQWLGRFSNKYAGNYKNKYDGKVLNTGFEEYNGNLFLGINKNWGYTHLNISSFNTSINLPEGERDNLGNFVFENADGNIVTATDSDLNGYKKGFPYQTINHFRVSANNYFILKNGTLNIDLGLQNNKRREYASIANPNEVALFFDLHTFNYNARYNLEKTNGWETAIGINGMQQSHINKGNEYLIPNYRFFDIGAFVYTQKIFKDRLTVAGGLRFDNRTLGADQLILDSAGQATNVQDGSTELKFSGISQNFNGLSGSIGLSYQASQSSTIKLNVSRGFRAPNIAELASNGRHEGTFRYEIGNSKLQSEVSHQFDIAYFLNSEHISLELTPFANVIDHYIYAQKLTDSQGNEIIFDPTDPAPAFGFVQDKATLLGGEIYLDIHPHPLDWLHIANSFAFVQATQSNATDSTKFLPFIPAPKYRGELKAEFKNMGKVFTNTYIKFGIDHFFSQNNVFSAYNTETPTPAYTLFSAGFGGNIKIGDKKDFMSVFVSAENLTDIAYQNHLNRLKYAPQNSRTGRNGIFNQGRNISIKLLINL